jgi:hypothetical protein
VKKSRGAGSTRGDQRRADQTIDEFLMDLMAKEVRSGRIPPEEIEERLAAAVRATTPASASRMARRIQRGAPRQLRELNRLQARFQQHIQKEWGEAIDALELLAAAFRDFANQLFSEGLARRQLKDPTFRALADLHARACRVTAEIICLLRNGYADGAHGRWRTLHEITVVSDLLSTHGRDLAAKYLRHAYVKMCQAAEEYQEHCHALGGASIPGRSMAVLRRRRNYWCKKFGKHFSSPWGWATGLNGNPRPNFRFLEEVSSMEGLRPSVATANDDVHAGPLGLQPSGVALHGHGFLLAGGSDAGLADPGANTAISLTNIARARLNTAPSIENLLVVETIQLLQKHCIDAFHRCDESVRRRTEQEIAKWRRRKAKTRRELRLERQPLSQRRKGQDPGLVP